MEDKKIELLEKLIKENKISLKEALVLIGENEEKIVIQRIPSQLPYTNPRVDPHWRKPYEIYCGRDSFTTTGTTTAFYPKGTTVSNII
jgi:hypothetical protein